MYPLGGPDTEFKKMLLQSDHLFAGSECGRHLCLPDFVGGMLVFSGKNNHGSGAVLPRAAITKADCV
jgi:hypothetical protein